MPQNDLQSISLLPQQQQQHPQHEQQSQSYLHHISYPYSNQYPVMPNLLPTNNQFYSTYNNNQPPNFNTPIIINNNNNNNNNNNDNFSGHSSKIQSLPSIESIHNSIPQPSQINSHYLKTYPDNRQRYQSLPSSILDTRSSLPLLYEKIPSSSPSQLYSNSINPLQMQNNNNNNNNNNTSNDFALNYIHTNQSYLQSSPTTSPEITNSYNNTNYYQTAMAINSNEYRGVYEQMSYREQYEYERKNNHELKLKLLYIEQQQALQQKKRKYKLWSEEEDKLLIDLKSKKCMSWKKITEQFSDRTLNACQFRWRKLGSALKNDNLSSIQMENESDDSIAENIDQNENNNVSEKQQ
jgi:hypothetical protein